MGGHPVVDEPIPAYIADAEAAVHDESRLPHMYSSEDIARLVPTIEAAPEQPNTNDYIDDHRRHHENGTDIPRRRLGTGARPAGNAK